MPCSAEASGMRSSRLSSLLACFSASSDIPALSIGLAQLLRSRPRRPRLRRVPSEFGEAAHAGCAPAGDLRASLASAHRSAWTGAGPRSAWRPRATACRYARRHRTSPSRSCFSAGDMSATLAMKSASAEGESNCSIMPAELRRGTLGSRVTRPHGRARAVDACARQARWNRPPPRRSPRSSPRGTDSPPGTPAL